MRLHAPSAKISKVRALQAVTSTIEHSARFSSAVNQQNATRSPATRCLKRRASELLTIPTELPFFVKNNKENGQPNASCANRAIKYHQAASLSSYKLLLSYPLHNNQTAPSTRAAKFLRGERRSYFPGDAARGPKGQYPRDHSQIIYAFKRNRASQRTHRFAKAPHANGSASFELRSLTN